MSGVFKPADAGSAAQVRARFARQGAKVPAGEDFPTANDWKAALLARFQLVCRHGWLAKGGLLRVAYYGWLTLSVG